MEQELISRVKQAKGLDAKNAAMKVLRGWRMRDAMIAKYGGNEEAADAAIAAAEAKNVADRVCAREREIAACGDRRALEFQIAPIVMDHRTSQGYI
jgi:hypothetical protein